MYSSSLLDEHQSETAEAESVGKKLMDHPWVLRSHALDSYKETLSRERLQKNSGMSFVWI